MRFRDSIIWITGASSGIGEALCQKFCNEGAHIVLSARRVEELQRVAKTCNGPGEILVQPLDICDLAEIDQAAEAVLHKFGRVDVQVNTAGLTQRARVIDAELSVYRNIMDVNFFGPLMMTKALLPSMIRRKAGKIVCVTSVAGKYGSPMRSGYNAAKHALHGFFDSLREEVYADGIDVTLAVPGAVQTNISLNALRGDGSPYDKMDPFLENGMSAGECASRIIDAVHSGKREILIAEGIARRNVWLKRWSPKLLSKVMRQRRTNTRYVRQNNIEG